MLIDVQNRLYTLVIRTQKADCSGKHKILLEYTQVAIVPLRDTNTIVCKFHQKVPVLRICLPR